MLRILKILPLAAAMAACSSGRATRPDIPRSPPEFRATAASFLGHTLPVEVGDAAEIRPRIVLAPSPGKEPVFGAPTVEILAANTWSGAYVAFTSQVPVTRYFRILGPADCDDWVYLQLMNPKMVRTNPMYYMGGGFHGGESTWKCLGLAHERYRAKSDPRLAGSDGAIFDAETARFLEIDGFTIGHKKFHMDGWAIRFEDPAPQDLAARLAAARPLNGADRVQMRAALHWIAGHHATQYAGQVKALLPTGDKTSILNAWNEVSLAALETLAGLGWDPADAPLWWRILEGGITPWASGDRWISIPGRTVGNAPFVAANMLLCNADSETVKRLKTIVEQSVISQHKVAAGKALGILDPDALARLIQANRAGRLSHLMQVTGTRGARNPYRCPYRSPGYVG